MSFCLPKFAADAMLEKFKSGELNPEKLQKMSSEERRAMFEFVGVENAKRVNALFESKLLLKNQQLGMINWAKQITGLKPEVKRDIMAKIERLDKVLTETELDKFLSDLAEQRLGFGVTMEEAAKIVEMTKTIDDLGAKIPADAKGGTPEELAFGTAQSLFKQYIDALKINSVDKHPLLAKYKEHPMEIAYDVGGTSKSILSSLDNSFFGRQGLKVLFNKPEIWTKNFLKSWGDIAKELRGIDAKTPIEADVLSRPNARSGKYKYGGYAVDIMSEEAFPTSLPEKVPVLGRLFKASTSAYNGGALRMRADYADHMIKLQEEFGIDTLRDPSAKEMGELVNTLTGRGSKFLKKLQGTHGREINSLFFSIKYLSSNIQTLMNLRNIGHVLDSKGKLMKLNEAERAQMLVKREAARSSVRVIAGMAAILTIAEMLSPGSVETDPRSSDFGKIKIGDTRFDISGGMAGLVTLATRIMPSFHNDKWGWWEKTTAGYKEIGTGKFGNPTPLDVLLNFAENKTSPAAGLVIDVLKQKDHNFKKPTVSGEALNLITPLPVSDAVNLLNNPRSADFLSSMILMELGIGVNTYSK